MRSCVFGLALMMVVHGICANGLGNSEEIDDPELGGSLCAVISDGIDCKQVNVVFGGPLVFQKCGPFDRWGCKPSIPTVSCLEWSIFPQVTTEVACTYYGNEISCIAGLGGTPGLSIVFHEINCI